MNIAYNRRPRRKSMLGTRLSILHDNIELGQEDRKPAQEPIQVEPSQETKSFYDTRSRKAREDNESLTQILNNIENLLEKNSQTLQTLMQEREQLENMERMLKDKINSTRKNNEFEACKENQPPNYNSPSKSNYTSNRADFCNESTPTKLLSKREGHKKDDEFTAPHNPDIDLMRSSIKYLKTPRPSRQPRKSIMLTPHSFSFSIHKQFESLKE